MLDLGGGLELVLEGHGFGASAGLGLLVAAGDGCKRRGSGFGAIGGGGGFTLGLGATGSLGAHSNYPEIKPDLYRGSYQLTYKQLRLTQKVFSYKLPTTINT